MGVVADLPTEGLRQLERAARLVDAAAGAPRGSRAPIHKALEQLFGEARGRSQPQGLLGAAPYGSAGASWLLQGPQAQRLERELADFSLAGPAPGLGGASGGKDGGGALPEEQPNLGVREFFAQRHERVLLGVVQETQQDATRSFEQRSVERVQGDWEETKAQLLSHMAPQRPGSGAALCGPIGGEGAAAGTLAAPPQDVAIVEALREPISQALVLRIGQLSCDSCPPYRGELMECWSIVSHSLEPTPRGVTCGALRYLQNRYAEEVRATVYRLADARLGGVPDAWSLVCAFGRVKFETPVFPAAPVHVWYAAYVAARAGLAHLLPEIPERAVPFSDRCPLLRTVCGLMARRLQATAMPGPAAHAAAAGDVDRADLLRADLSEESGSFQDVLVALLLGRGFAFGRLPEGTIEDWLWFRLHAVHLAAGDDGGAPEFERQLEALRQQALALPPSHYDPSPGYGGMAQAGMLPGLRLAGDPLSAGGASVGAAMIAGFTRTLNFVKVLLLTSQFGRAIQQLRSQDRALRGPAVHVALVLHHAGTLDALAAPDPPLNVMGLVCDYASQFRCSDQLQYFGLLDPPDRAQALQRLLLRGGTGTNDELLGYIDNNGRHRPGLLEKALRADGLDDQASDFVDFCARAGRAALDHGQYREALRLLHLGRCHSDVLQVLCRCLRLSVWHEPATATSNEATALGQDVQRFFAIYERNLDRYALSSQSWAAVRKLYAARMFHSLCQQGLPEAALDVFDREQLLPLGGQRPDADIDGEMLGEYPRIVCNYVRILQHAASRGAVGMAAFQARVRQLQGLLAVHSHRLVLDQETVAALATLTLC